MFITLFSAIQHYVAYIANSMECISPGFTIGSGVDAGVDLSVDADFCFCIAGSHRLMYSDDGRHVRGGNWHHFNILNDRGTDRYISYL